ATRRIQMLNRFLVLAAAVAISSAANASPINTVASDKLVQDLTSRLAAQVPSGDPVYCSFDKPKEIELKDTANDLDFQVEIDCGVGTKKSHMNDIKIFVKGYMEDSEIYVTGLQLGKKL